MFFPPVTFCRSDTVQPSMLRNEQKLFSDVENDEIVKFAVTSRSSRLKNGVMIQYTNDLKFPMPSKPKEVVDFAKMLVTDEEQKVIVDLFEKRPIWTLAAMRAHIKVPPKRLSRILANIAFYFTTGPWRKLLHLLHCFPWQSQNLLTTKKLYNFNKMYNCYCVLGNCFVRFGYDPRKDFSSRYLQMLDYRVKQNAGFKVDSQLKRPSAIHKRIRVHQNPNTASLTAENIEENFILRQKEAIFDKDTIPPFRARQYQFVDIHLPKVQEMLENVPGPLTGIVCNEKRGWLPPQFIEDIREMLTNIAQANMMKLCKEKNLTLEDTTTESIGESIDQNEDIFDENNTNSGSDNESNHEPEDMEIDDLK